MIKSEKQYEAILERIEELLLLTSNDTPKNSKENIELDLLSDLVSQYEELTDPIEVPSLADVLKLRMAELKLTQLQAAKMLKISPPRISEYIKGKEPTLQIARRMSIKFNISPTIVLGIHKHKEAGVVPAEI